MPKTSRFWFITAALFLLAAALMVESFRSAAAANSPAVSATWSHSALHVSIPFQGLHAGEGQLAVELLDPEDHVLGRSDHTVAAAATPGAWHETVALTKPMELDDLVWHRLHYRFTYAGAREPEFQGTESVSSVLRRPVLHIIGQQSYLSGGPAAVRVVVTDSNNEPLAGAGALRIELAPANQPARVLYSGALNARGTAEAQFRFPTGLVGSFPLQYSVETPIGSTQFTQQVRLEDKASILLTTEKPLYQPGQTIHVRALALDRANHQATAAHNLTFEIEDSRGNKVFRKATRTDQFGIASAEFALADEVNLGTYHLRALMDQNRAETALNVERYVLPKFKVAVDFSGAAKHGYRPGDHVTGTVRANYFFGKPVDGAEVSIKATGMDVVQFEAATAQGKTDSDGAWRFDLQLPKYFAGRPLSQGAARVLVEASVKDSAAHTETRGEPVTVSESPLILTAVPEGGTIIPGLENQVFILASYADGKPAVADIKAAGQSATTDAGGVAVISLKAAAAAAPLQIESADREGNHASTSVPLQSRNGADQILLRTERAVYRAGDHISLKVFATKERGTAYVDIVREGQTVLTRDLDIVNGQAQLSLAVTADLAGTLDCNAYLFGSNAIPVADHRLLFVQPADELKIQATADAASYKPGDDAHVRFRVTNSKGEGVQAALGLQVVDEAVFALAEKQPGFAKVFFYLEQEAMKPRYEIHSIGMPEVVEPAAQGEAAQRDRAARALFAATEMVNPNKFQTEVGRDVPRTKFQVYHNRYEAGLVAQVRQLKPEDLTASAGPRVRDAWGTALRVDHPANNGFYIVRSAGPDKQFLSPDDLFTYATVQHIPGPPTAGTMNWNVEHDRGAFNGLAAITGSVVDQKGAAVPGATVRIREKTSGKIRTAAARNGQFDLSAVLPGTYEVEVSAEGFQLPARELTLNARDRAVLTAALQTGSARDQVEPVGYGVGGGSFGRGGVGGGGPVNRMRVGGNAEMMALGGVAGGVPGGVIGGIVGNAPAAAPAPVFEQMDRAMLMAPTTGALKRKALDAKDSLTIRESEAAPRVRSYFPEALYINPEIITDQHGLASISIPLADSITTWRMALMASTIHGALGSGSSSLKVFQDFFTDLDMPVTLTQGDRVSIPVAVYNYSAARGDVSLQLKPDAWYALADNDTALKTLAVDAGRVGGAQFTVEAKRIGKFKLTLAANMAGAAKRADIVVREIEVIPNGREQTQVFNGRLETVVNHDLNFPAAAIPDAGKVLVRLYPGPLSQVIEGMDSLLRMPSGCFEQTSSATYPNVLALDYMKRTKKLTPEVHAKAEGFIVNGYQRLLTFEVPGGGFSWFGQAPANKILTAYGLMEFSDMAKVHDVDPNLIRRTQQWLASQQQPDGSWKPDTNFINEGATNRYNSDPLRITAYIAWSLENTGFQGPAVEKARQFVGAHMGEKADAYSLAVLANFAADYAKDRAFTNQAMQLLLDARTEKDEQAWWNSAETGVYATGESAAVETTGLAVQALLKWGQASATATKALNYIAAKKDASGTWRTTQATIMALRALLLSTEKGAADVRGTVEVTLNGKPTQTLTLTADNNDLLHQFVFPVADGQPNSVALRFTGKGALAYQVVGRYFVPWDVKPAGEPLSITVDYDRTRLAQDDVATATATVKNNLPKSANMIMVDLGIPPGFDLLSEDLQSFQEKTANQKGGRLEKFNLTATQAILYFDSIAPGATVKLTYRLRAKYPLRAKTFQSRVYEYYDPAVSAVARPVQLEVRK